MAPLTLDDLLGIFLSQSYYLDCLGMEKERCVLVQLTAVYVSTHTLYSTHAVPSFMILLSSVSFAVNADKDGE